MSELQKQALKRLAKKAEFSPPVSGNMADEQISPINSQRHEEVRNKADSLLKLSFMMDASTQNGSPHATSKKPLSNPNSGNSNNNTTTLNVRIAEPDVSTGPDSTNSDSNKRKRRSAFREKSKSSRSRSVGEKKRVQRVKLKRVGGLTATVSSSGKLSARTRRRRRAVDDFKAGGSRRSSLPNIGTATDLANAKTTLRLSKEASQFEEMSEELTVIALAKSRQALLISPYGLPSKIDGDDVDFTWDDAEEKPYEKVNLNAAAAAEAEAKAMVEEARAISKKTFVLSPELREALNSSNDVTIDATSSLQATDPLYEAKKGAYQFILKSYQTSPDQTVLEYEAYLTHCSESNLPPVDPRLFDEQLLKTQLSIKKLEAKPTPTAPEMRRGLSAPNAPVSQPSNGQVLVRMFCHALDCYNDEHYEEAARCFELLASVGHTGAQFSMACCYDRGLGVKQDNATALKYFMLAAVQNHPVAQLCVGACYYAGHGLRRDDAKAVYWFKKAVDRNNTAAMFYLAGCYMRGEGDVNVSVHAAVKLYKLAAAQGYPEASCALARLYSEGKGHADEDERFDELNSEMANVGINDDDSDDEAMRALAPKPIVSNADKKTAYKLWLHCAKSSNLSAAHVHVGLCLLKGDGCAKDVETSVKHFERAASQNLARGLALLAASHWKGHVSNPVHARAHRMFERAISLGDRRAVVELREMTREDLEFLAPSRGYVSRVKKLVESKSFSSSKDSKDSKKLVEERNLILDELVESESLYCYQLFLLDRHYLRPVVEQKLANLNIHEIVSECASAVTELAHKQKTLLSKMRQESNNKNSVPMILRDTISSLGKHYITYATIYAAVIRGLGGAGVSRELRKHLDTKAQAYGHDSIAQMLVLPIQRIPRYILLLDSLLEATPSSYRYYKEWCSTFMKVAELAKDVESCRQTQPR